MNKTVIFDLDGTLCDTILDIVQSVNRTREDYNLPALPIDVVTAFTGDGARKLLERSLEGTNVNIDEALPKMIQHYADHPAENTKVYPQVLEGLKRLKEAGWKLAIVTNKPGNVARLITAATKLDEYLDDCIGGNDGFALKPDPEAIHYLLKKYNSCTQNAWILGDNHTDINSGAKAQISSAFATWGFGTLENAPYTIKVNCFNEFVDYLLK